MALTITKLYNISQNKEELKDKLQEWKLMPLEEELLCPTCNNRLKLGLESDIYDGYQWKCYNQVFIRKQNKKDYCGYQRSIREGTIFEKSKLSIFQMLGFMHLWVMNAQLRLISSELEIPYKTCINWAGYCREILLQVFFQKPQKLGGPNKIVEIDEGNFVKRKYLKAYHVEGQLVFGGYERGSGRIFMVAVEQSDRDTLLPIIETWIEKGTTIYSDCWRSYINLSEHGYNHLTVNHLITFKDEEPGVHTNSIKSSWRHAKSVVLSNGRKKAHVPGNLAKYMFFRKCKELRLNRTTEFFAYAGSLYDPAESQDVDILITAEDEHFSNEEEIES